MLARIKTWLCLLVLLILGVKYASGQTVTSLTNITVTNYTGYLINSDATQVDVGGSPDIYHRDAIRVSTTIGYSVTAGSRPVTSNYRVKFRLLDQGGQPVEILDQLGNTNTAYDVDYSVTLPFTIFNFTINSTSRTSVAPLKPVNWLNTTNSYTVEAEVYKVTGVGKFEIATDTHIGSTAGAYSFVHFTSTVSGDVDLNVVGVMSSGSFSKTYLIPSVPGKDLFSANANFTLFRYDNFFAGISASSIPVGLDLELRDSVTDALIPLADSSDTFTVPMASLRYGLSPPGFTLPVVTNVSHTVSFKPAPGTQLDPVTKFYKLTITLKHKENPLLLAYTTANSATSPAARLLHFNGKLIFGDIETGFTSIANSPFTIVVNSPTYITSQLAVDANSGFVVGSADHIFGDGTPLNVRLTPNGTAFLNSGSVILTGPSPDLAVVENVRFLRGAVTLNTVGGFADLLVGLPAGYGYRADITSKILTGTLFFGGVRLNQALEPASDLEDSNHVFGCEETKPLWIEAIATLWRINTGEFVLKTTGHAVYVRGDELDTLQAASVVSASMKIKRSNEQYFRAIDTVISPEVVIKAGSDGAALLSGEFSINPGLFRTHFPYDARIGWTGVGSLNVKEDLIDPTTSSLEGVVPVQMKYARDCAATGCPGGVGPDALKFVPNSSSLRITPDGGLEQIGKLDVGTPLDWGWINVVGKYAQRTTEFIDANFAMGGFFIRGDQSDKNVFLKPGVILFTGVDPADLNKLERPGTPQYLDGFGDYPGLNFRVGTDNAKQAESVLASKPTGLYPLTGRSKYYTRFGGVSGIHEAVFGQFPPTAILYGYKINFSNYGLAYLDSQNVDSRTEGYVHVPAPSNIDQNFEELRFTCLGALDKAKVPNGEAGLMKVLEYWQADFSTLAISFQSDVACDPGVGYLVLGVQAWASHVDDPLYGSVGFMSSGELIRAADGILNNFDSRLKLPNSFKFHGPGTEKYSFTSVSDAYYNHHADSPPGPGFINMAGKCDVPFFEDLKVHLHTSAKKTNTTAVIYLMGGWPSHGFEIAGKNFFNQAGFDDRNKGFPDGVTVENYRKGNTDGLGKYLVRAQRNWLGVIDLDYPLSWSTATRSFKSFQPVHNDLLVVNVEHQVKYLSAKNAELTFGIEYEGIPKVNLANLAFNAVDQASGVTEAFANAGLGAARGVIDEAMGKMNTMLNAELKEFFDKPFDDILQPVIHALYLELKSNWNPGTKTWTVNPNTIIDQYCLGGGPVPNLRNKLKNILGNSPIDLGVIKEIDENLKKVEDAIDSIDSILAKTDGHRTIASQLIKELIGELAAQFAGAILDDKLNALLADADPTLDEVESALHDFKDFIHTVRSGLQAGQEVVNELKAKLLSFAGEIDGITTSLSSDVRSFVGSINISIDDPFVHYSEQEIENFIRQKVEDRFFGTQLVAALQSIIKQRLYDVDTSIREGMDSMFQQFNGLMRSLINETLSQVDNEINGFLGKASGVMGAGRITGYAHINGDSLKLLRLDIYAQLKVPSEMELNAYIQIKELDSDGTPAACLPPSGKATEVSMGADDVKVGWISPDLRASVGAKFTFDSGITPPLLINVAGKLELNGAISFEAFEINRLAAAMAFGELENYFSAAAGIKFNKYEGFGGIYFGKTCTLDPIAMWDPEVAAVLGTPPFTGAYVYAEATIPISEALLGIPASCFFEISAEVGAGAFFFIEGPTFGGKMLLGASGEVLCIVSVEGKVKLIGVKNPSGLTLKGTGELSGEIGFCPLCISFSKSLGITYKNGSWDIDF